MTRLSPRGLRGLRASLSLSETVVGQLADLPGFRGGRLLLDHRLDLWTLTTWSDRPALAAFRVLHEPVVARIGEVARAATTTDWQATDLPTWADVRLRWTAGGGAGRGPGRGPGRPLRPSTALVAA